MEIRACVPVDSRRSYHSSDYGLATWKGMGQRRFNSAACCPFLFIIKLIIFCSLFETAISQFSLSDCKVLRCTKQYSSATDTLSDEDVLPQCQALERYRICIQKTASSCRGDLNYHTITTYIPDYMQMYDCDNVLASVPTTRRPPKGTRQLTVTTARRPRPTVKERDRTCDYRGPRKTEDLAHCGIFGDPHLRTFSDEFQTCKVSGAWPLVYNDYLAVSVTNIPVNGSSGATATSKISVVIKAHENCAEQKIYFAESGRLPAAFLDGTNTSGPSQSVVVLEVTKGKHVEIHLQYVATTIVLRQVGRFLTFALSMPRDLIQNKEEDSLQLCVKGCPLRERIYFKEFLDNRYKQLENLDATRTSRIEAITKCKKAEVTNDYFDSCVFDIMTTGNANFSLAAQHAFMDVKRLHPNPSFVLKNRTSIFEKEPPPVEKVEEDIRNRTNILNSSSTWTIICLLVTFLATLTER